VKPIVWRSGHPQGILKEKDKTMNQSETLTDHIVAVYPSHDQVESAVKLLSESGFEMKNLSIVGQNYATEEHPIGFVNMGDRVKTWGKQGAFWGAIWGLLFGSAMVVVPGIGAVLFAGWIVSAVEGAIVIGGLAALGGALASIGIPKDTVVQYETELKAGSFLLVAHGDAVDVERAKVLLGTTTPSSIDSFSTAKDAVGV
jgi:hypothetical protein